MSSSTTQSQAVRLVIMGRPNVGKSTLFNRLFGRRRALVHDEPGVTRDRLEEGATWWVRGKQYAIRLIDTGGIGGERWANEIQRQVEIALEEADVIVAVFDGQMGYTPQDQAVIRGLLRTGPVNRHGRKIPIIGAVNKVDDEVHESMLADFFASRLDPLITISAEHDRGIDELKEAIIDLGARPGAEISPVSADQENEESEEEAFPDTAMESEVSEFADSDLELSEGHGEGHGESHGESSPEDSQDESLKEEAPHRPIATPRIAIVGRPNVGKSTLVNALTRQERMITSPIAGTTVDAVDSMALLDGHPVILVDTAGIRRKSKTEQGIEVLSVIQTRKALENCDVAILLLDAESGVLDQDEKIAGMIEEVGCGVVLMVNKWDLMRNSQGKAMSRDEAAEEVRRRMAFLKYAPLLFVSAKESRGFQNLGDLVLDILEQRRLKITTHEFTEWVRRESEVHNPMNAKFYLCHQSGRNPPTFVCHVNDPKKVHFSLKRYLLNALRERWGFMGSPVRLLFIQGKSNRPAKRPPAAR